MLRKQTLKHESVKLTHSSVEGACAGNADSQHEWGVNVIGL